VDKFGLLGWEIYVEHENSNLKDTNIALAMDIEGHTCTIFLHKNVDEPFDPVREA
jgi:hypothetical protein